MGNDELAKECMKQDGIQERMKQERILEEYKLLEGYRETLSQRIGTLQSILVPAIFLIMAAFLSRLDLVLQFGALFAFAYLLSCLSLVILLFRGAQNSMKEQDSAIVGMYPRMLELELEQGEMDFHGPYYYSRLDEASKKWVGGQLRDVLKSIDIGKIEDEELREIITDILSRLTSDEILEKIDYQVFRALLGLVEKRPQTVLLEAWKKFKYASVIKGKPPAKRRGQAALPELLIGIVGLFFLLFLFIYLGADSNWWPIFPPNGTVITLNTIIISATVGIIGIAMLIVYWRKRA